ncbi:MAG: hypothetical protein R6V04_12925 [bacterium]
MTTIRKAVKDDFELVYPLLQRFKSRYLTREDWKKLFYRNWDRDEGYCGYIMLDDKEPVGFLGLLFHRRTVGGENCQFCNLTSWIVKEEFRSKSIFMLQPILKLKSYTITDLTPSKEVYLLLKRAGFQHLESHYRFIFPFPCLIKKNTILSFITDNKYVKEKLYEFNLQIFNDHQFKYCQHIIVQTSEGECYIVMTRMVRKRAPFLMARIHYISNIGLFLKYFDSIRFRLCFHFKVLAIVVDERFLGDKRIIFSKKLILDNKPLFRSSKLNKYDIDNLYSELILFNI